MNYQLYGMNLSYFTGKMEGYLRYKEIPHTFVPLNRALFGETVLKNTGLMKMPAIACDDGTWLTDTTPMIGWFEERYTDVPVLPDDPALAFIARLLEDYADEWLWRPALHYRWSYPKDAELLGTRIAAEMMEDVKLPFFMKKRAIQKRQMNVYVKGDGMTDATRAHVEGTYLRTLDWLQAIFEVRPYILGARPSLADFGFFASMFRHFSLDPTPQRIMTERAPAVYEWVARMWNAKASQMTDPFLEALPDDIAPLLSDVGSMYMPYLKKNAAAFAEGRTRFDAFLEGNLYKDLPVSQYRVHCLEELQKHYGRLEDDARVRVETWLAPHNIIAGLTEVVEQASYYDPDGLLPVAQPLDLDGKALGALARRGTIWGR